MPGLGAIASALNIGPRFGGLEYDLEGDTSFEELAYREAYRKFRLGHHRGAKGEVADVGLEEEGDVESDAGCWENVLGIDGFTGDEQLEASYKAVREYRLAYRRHRLGAARGAKGEVADVGRTLSVADCRLLPASQLVQFRKQLLAWNSAVNRGDFQDLQALHLHVGAGKIGLGLVLPALVQSGRPFAILQRPSGAWSHALSAGKTAVRVNGERITELRVVSNIREVDDALNVAREDQANLLVLSEDPAVVCSLAARTASCSCAVGGKDLSQPLAPLIEAICSVHQKAAAEISASGVQDAKPPMVPLYACENDHEAVDKLAESLAGKAEIVPVLVDRVCTTRDMREDGSVDVITEPYAGDIVLPPPSDFSMPRPPLPFSGSSVKVPQTEEGTSFLHRKKILTVNGTHTTIAFLSLVAGEPPGHEGPPSGSHELLQFDVDGPEGSVGRMVWTWAVARQVMLLYEFDEDVVRHTMLGEGGGGPQDLVRAFLDGARTSVGRLSQGGDQTSRVLGGGVENRWRTRLQNVEVFLQANTRLDKISKALLHGAGVPEEELRSSVSRLVRDTRRFVLPPRSGRSPSPKRFQSPLRSSSRQNVASPKRFQPAERGKGSLAASLASAADGDPNAGCESSIAVLFDYDGTIGDTETPAMEVAFWEIAPYLPQLAKATRAELEAACPVYVRENAGKAFEHMIEACDKARTEASLPPAEETRKLQGEPAGLLAEVDAVRVALGLQAISELRARGAELPTLLQQQKEETVTRMSIVSRANPGVEPMLDSLREMSCRFVIATTSGKPRVPVCVDAAGLRKYFPSDSAHIHSGESDFDPPKFKPAPDVYLRAAQAVDRLPACCVAVEDSASGVGSASNAGIGLIVGYVGASHISAELKESHARMLMAGARADNKRGADVVISHMQDLPKLVARFREMVEAGAGGDGLGPALIAASDVAGAAAPVFTRS